MTYVHVLAGSALGGHEMRTGISAEQAQQAAAADTVRLTAVTDTPPIADALKAIGDLTTSVVSPEEVWGGTWLGCDVAILHADPARVDRDERVIEARRSERSQTDAPTRRSDLASNAAGSDRCCKPTHCCRRWRVRLSAAMQAAGRRSPTRRRSRCARCRPPPAGSPGSSGTDLDCRPTRRSVRATSTCGWARAGSSSAAGAGCEASTPSSGGARTARELRPASSASGAVASGLP